MTRPNDVGSTSVHSEDHRLSYADCDPAGIVYFATWFPLMERVHTGWWLERGYRFDTLEQSHGSVPVTRHAECSYTAFTRLFDVVRCSMRIEGVGRTSYQLGFHFIHVAGGHEVAYGRLGMVNVAPGTGPVPLPDALSAVLTPHAQG